jgi:hypothetical protein
LKFEFFLMPFSFTFVKMSELAWLNITALIFDPADPDCQNEELPSGSVPGSRIEEIFGDASLVPNADNAKQSRK